MTVEHANVEWEQNSQLGLWRRITLLIQNPRDAFTLYSFAERRSTAWIIFLLYFLIKLPIIIQKPALSGKFDGLNNWQAVLFFAAILIAGMVLTAIFLGLIALIMHLCMNKWKSAGLQFEDTFTLLLLSLAPQLLLVYELPFLIADYHNADSYLTVLMLRLVVDLISFRTFYWGLRVLFNVTQQRAIAAIFLPVLILILALAKLVLE